MVKDVEELRVYQLAYDISLEIHKATLSFPKIEQYDLASQMRRASKSLCANLAEGFEKQQFSKAEFKRFVGIAIGSAREMRTWICYARDFEYISHEDAKCWQENYQSISKMLQKLHNNVT